MLSVAHGKTYLPNWLLNNDLKDHFFSFLLLFFFLKSPSQKKAFCPCWSCPQHSKSMPIHIFRPVPSPPWHFGTSLFYFRLRDEAAEPRLSAALLVRGDAPGAGPKATRGRWLSARKGLRGVGCRMRDEGCGMQDAGSEGGRSGPECPSPGGIKGKTLASS